MTKPEARNRISLFAKTVYRDLKLQGFDRAEILAFANEILGHVTDDARARREEAEAQRA